MTITQEPQRRCNVQTVSDEYRRGVKVAMPQMANFLDLLDSGITPNFLDVIGAISDLVAFHTECDPKADQLVDENILMSPKVCRFCC